LKSTISLRVLYNGLALKSLCIVFVFKLYLWITGIINSCKSPEYKNHQKERLSMVNHGEPFFFKNITYASTPSSSSFYLLQKDVIIRS